MSPSTKTLLFAAVLTAGICGASLFRKPPGATGTVDATAPEAATMTHRLDGPRVVLAPTSADRTLPGETNGQRLGGTGSATGSPRASMAVDGGTSDPPSFPAASPIGGFPLSAPPPWPRDPADDDAGEFGRRGGTRRHRVEDGDTLAALAQRYLGDAGRADEIRAANRDVLPASGALPIGAELVIPPLAGVPRGGDRAADRATPAEPVSTRSANNFPRQPAVADRTYEAAAVGDPALDRPAWMPAWMSEPSAESAAVPNNPVAPGVIRPASEALP